MDLTDSYYTLDMDEDNLTLLIDVLATSIALAETEENSAQTQKQAIRVISVGTPLLEEMRAARAASQPRLPTPHKVMPEVLPTCRKHKLQPGVSLARQAT